LKNKVIKIFPLSIPLSFIWFFIKLVFYKWDFVSLQGYSLTFLIFFLWFYFMFFLYFSLFFSCLFFSFFFYFASVQSAAYNNKKNKEKIWKINKLKGYFNNVQGWALKSRKKEERKKTTGAKPNIFYAVIINGGEAAMIKMPLWKLEFCRQTVSYALSKLQRVQKNLGVFVLGTRATNFSD
jgi:hypothetical protein